MVLGSRAARRTPRRARNPPRAAERELLRAPAGLTIVRAAWHSTAEAPSPGPGGARGEPFSTAPAESLDGPHARGAARDDPGCARRRCRARAGVAARAGMACAAGQLLGVPRLGGAGGSRAAR